jgi:hypothetical protein
MCLVLRSWPVFCESVGENRGQMKKVMRTDSKWVLVYSIVVAVLTLLYVGYEDLGFMNGAAANPATAQVDADDE